MKKESSGVLLLRVLVFSFIACLWLPTGGLGGEPGNSAEERLLNDLITVYFSSWSKADMGNYKGCFHPQATIYYLDGSGNPHFYRLEEFVAAQEKAQLRGPKPMSERPTHTSLTVLGRVARGEVRWELQGDSTIKTGTDYFTFIKTDTGWKILSLIYEQDKK